MLSISRLYYLGVGTVCTSLLLAGNLSFAHKHVSPSGLVVTWYEPDCCNIDDCAPVVEIQPATDGSLMRNEYGLSVVVPNDYKTRPSKDMRWHTCIGKTSKKLLCVYEPPSVSMRRHLARAHD